MMIFNVCAAQADRVEVHFNSRDIESAVQAGAAAYTGVSVAFVSGGGDDDDDWFIGIFVIGILGSYESRPSTR